MFGHGGWGAGFRNAELESGSGTGDRPNGGGGASLGLTRSMGGGDSVTSPSAVSSSLPGSGRGLIASSAQPRNSGGVDSPGHGLWSSSGGMRSEGRPAGLPYGHTDAPIRLSDQPTPSPNRPLPASRLNPDQPARFPPSTRRVFGRFIRPQPPPLFSALETNIRLSQVASRLLWVVIFSYTALLIAGVLLAFAGVDDLRMQSLLLLDSLVMMAAYAAVFVRLGARFSDWPNRFHRACGMLLLLIVQLATHVSGAIMGVSHLAFWATTTSALLLSLALLMLALWLRGAHMQVAEKVSMGIVPEWRAAPPAPIRNAHVVDISCCGWLGRDVGDAWPERDTPQRHLPPTGSRNSHASRQPQLLTWRRYFDTLWEHLTNAELANSLAPTLSPTPMGHHHHAHHHHPHHHHYMLHMTPGGGNGSGSGSRRYPQERRHPRASNAPSPSIGAVPPLLSSSHGSHRRMAGMPSQDNAPAEKATGSHKYYCPLCMLYYAEVYKTHCCNNYVCQECSVMYISGKRKRAEQDMLAALSMDFDDRRPLMASNIVECPYCQKSGMMLMRVNPWEGVKTYEDSEASSIASSMSHLDNGSFTYAEKPAGKGKGKAAAKADADRIAIGDDFEALYRKIDYTGFSITEGHRSSAVGMELSPRLEEEEEEEEEGGEREMEEPQAEAGSARDTSDPEQEDSQPLLFGELPAPAPDGEQRDVLLPNETDHYPKGLSPEPSPTSERARQSRSSCLPVLLDLGDGSGGGNDGHGGGAAAGGEQPSPGTQLAAWANQSDPGMGTQAGEAPGTSRST